MSEASRFYYIHCLSPVHVGTGQGVGLIDQPMMRERITGWPVVPGSTIKGVLRDYYTRNQESVEWLSAAFGKATDHKRGEWEDGHAGSLSLSDARLLAFPVASLYGTFAYVTCPMALQRLLRDAAAAGIPMQDPGCEAIEKALREAEDIVLLPPGDSRLKDSKRTVVLDEFECSTREHPGLDKWTQNLASRLFEDEASRKIFCERLVIVSDEAFQYFSSVCCEVTTRIRINTETGTVDSGALWTEEYLPSESILYGLLWCDQVAASKLRREEVLQTLSGTLPLQIGGHVTVGKGRTRFRYDGGTAG